ncbi:amidohydrolase family protein [Alicyclobacillus fastidiosus]|uniref:Amidohydrolase family protein n=1 Tax=Alicyclobacillus fastidiosus TaxID=392011 RepID=A0ABV5AAB0_9BACL|nr:amidohydrolase family protein [Alicyclobacillus fastidiosus]WEH07701.1 amidohydrolase family protein [Alicyclobacillus fastidiosus]
MRIDAHQHFWKLCRGDYAWLQPDNVRLYRDFLPDDVLPHLAARGIDQTIVVQAAPTVAETEFLLELASHQPFIAGVVGWLDLASREFEASYHRLCQFEKFVGVRPMLQDLQEDDWVLQDVVIENISLLAKDSFPIDLLVVPRHLPYVRELLQRVPTLRAVIDHLAKPPIKDQVFEPWRGDMAEIAKYPFVMCKLSGMVTEADPMAWRLDDLRPYVFEIVSKFGPKRVMFGSDWPVCTEVASYEEVYDALTAILRPRLSDEQMRSVFGENAKEFYRLAPLR